MKKFKHVCVRIEVNRATLSVRTRNISPHQRRVNLNMRQAFTAVLETVFDSFLDDNFEQSASPFVSNICSLHLHLLKNIWNT